MRAEGGLFISLQLVRERHASSHPPLRVGAQDGRHDLHTHVLPADIAWQLPVDITATLSSAGYRAGGLLLAGRKLQPYFSLIPRVVSKRSGQCICCVWYSSVSCGDPSVHPWSTPLNVNQARNKTSQKVAYPSEAVFCCMSSSCVRWRTMRHYLKLRWEHPLLKPADVTVKLRMCDSSSIFRRLTT